MMDHFLNAKKVNQSEELSKVAEDIDGFSNELLNEDLCCNTEKSSDKLKTFFDVQHEKLKLKSELFSQVVDTNSEHFSHFLDKSVFEPFSFEPSNLTISRPGPYACNSSVGFSCKSGYFSSHNSVRNVSDTGSTKIKTSQSFQNVTASSFSRFNQVSLSSSDHNSVKSAVTHDCAVSKMHGISESFISSSEPSVSLSAYRMLLSQSTAKYSNSYVFSNKHFSDIFEHGYESMSESDEDEDEECTGAIGYPDIKRIEYDPKSVNYLPSGAQGLLMLEYDTKKDKIQQNLHKIVTELLTTERTYVAILYLLDQVFAFRVDQENRAHAMFPQDVVSQMFTNLKSLYKLHHDFLLPQLEERMKNWDSIKRVGDIMKNFAPFLKMYTEYVKNYDNAMNLINSCYQKHPRFAQIMDDIHRLEECKNLTIQHHMITPVQRVPRYQLLLKDYLKKLSDDSLDRPDTEKALELVSIAANHANDTIKKIDKFKKLLEVQELIGGIVDLVSPSRELLKEGKIIKISARSGDHQERYIFLFNDLLLLCSHRLMANKVVSGPCFRIRARLHVDSVIVEEGDNIETANTFYIRSTYRSIELYTPTLEEKLNWMQALIKAVNDLHLKKSSLKMRDKNTPSPDSTDLGKRAPNFVKLESVTHCMACDSQFNSFTFWRKHHCHACGIVACNKCLPHKMQLAYESNKSGRVCNACYNILAKDIKSYDSQEDIQRSIDSPQRQKGILDVMPTDPAVVSGYLQLKARSRFWVQRWFALHDDFVLYSFNSHLDEMALTSMPVPGYTVSMPDKGDNVDGREYVFKLFHKKKVYFFQTTDASEIERWLSALEKASKAETVS